MGPIKQYLTFVKPYRWMIVWTILIGIIKFSIPLATPLMLKFAIDDIINAESIDTAEKLTRLAYLLGAGAFLFVILRPPVEYYRQYFAQYVGNKVLFDIRSTLFVHIQKLSLKFYSNQRVGEIISRVIHDVEQTKSFVMVGLMNVWLDTATIIIAFAIMFWMDPLLALLSIVMFPFYGFAIKFFYGRLRSLTRDRSQALAEVQGHLHERVQGISVIRGFALEDHEEKQFAKRNDNFLARALDHTRWNAKTFAVINTVTDIAPLLVLGFATYRVIEGQLTVGELAAFVAFMERLYSPLRRLVNSSTTLTQSIASMDRVFEFANERYDVTDKAGAKQVEELSGRVTFDNVSFQYNDDESEVLKGLSLDVNPGETIALVGMSGGGKSTLISLIPRFYDVTEGRLLVDGIDVRDVQARSLRDQIGIVQQDNILFSDSVKENIKMGNPDATDEEVIQAAISANAHEFITELSDGYDTKVGERGVKLSGGQKQRVAIARVFLKNPPMLILDEATSALDLESEHLIQDALEKLAKHRTTFIVAHRLSTITHADRIVLVANGEIREQGTHSQLMTKRGEYFKLFSVQQLEPV
ncbi:ABC transporter ATP-binding protein [Aureibacillus halotolerans]|uniref:Subfamily B ATP-binding cassette protein MsbA n=1 Tax=Aureibacillus halotolerans TaxID=1508390 RepID=A0A4R6TX09_9BACI|nr:ABC transporter ATP-binding protein [Aureibacillus halotolerans]TDQ33742.1 subfamily B ATP-binding cassette protein MsbA [Aureibacillus halotolerans]